MAAASAPGARHRVTSRPGASPAAGVPPNQRDETVSPRSRHCSPTSSVVTPHGLPTTTVDSVAVGRGRLSGHDFRLLLLLPSQQQPIAPSASLANKDPVLVLSFRSAEQNTAATMASSSSSSSSSSTPAEASPTAPGNVFPGGYVPEREWAIVEAAPLPPFPIPGFCNGYVKQHSAAPVDGGSGAHHHQASLEATTLVDRSGNDVDPSTAEVPTDPVGGGADGRSTSSPAEGAPLKRFQSRTPP